jgi:putative ABC transport system permease protein
VRCLVAVGGIPGPVHGLVTLRGAFVGALFGGVSPAVTAQFQLVVLAGIALTVTITGVIVTRMLGRTPFVDVGAE